MKLRISVRISTALVGTFLASLSFAGSIVSLSAKSTWGGNGDGWWAPGEATYLTTDSNQRSLAYNPVTGNVLLVNALSVRVLDGGTGASMSLLNVTGIAGGDRSLNQIGVTSDGQIYGSNLRVTNSATASVKVYRWNDETAANTVAFDGLVRTGGRFGDSMDVFGSGSNVKVGLGANGGTGYGMLSGGLTLTSAEYPVAGTANGDFRLGFAFWDSDTVVGTQNATLAANGIRISSFSGSSATLDGTLTGSDQNERAIDFVTINGYTLMATIQSNSNLVRIYDVTALPTSGSITALASANLTSAFVANGNGTADLAFGGITGNTVSLYALNTNNGVQAFDVTVVPEPATMIALGAGAAALLRRRKRA